MVILLILLGKIDVNGLNGVHGPDSAVVLVPARTRAL